VDVEQYIAHGTIIQGSDGEEGSGKGKEKKEK
jgi:hypothetical protein